VKNLNTVYESLAEYVKGEIISDYNCGSCNAKVDINKR